MQIKRHPTGIQLSGMLLEKGAQSEYSKIELISCLLTIF
jgi:hypothetical protein